jgi:hypothetical protein
MYRQDKKRFCGRGKVEEKALRRGRALVMQAGSGVHPRPRAAGFHIDPKAGAWEPQEEADHILDQLHVPGHTPTY